MDHLPVAAQDLPPRPLPRIQTLVLLVGRVTTIKLAYWAAVTAVEVALPWALARPLSERLPLSYLALAILTVAALLWAVLAARALDRRAGGLQRSIPTIATTFAAASVVASPASLPLLLIERQRSIEGCVAPQICHWEAIWLWVLAFAVGTILIPAVLAAALPRRAIEPTGPAAPPLPRYR